MYVRSLASSSPEKPFTLWMLLAELEALVVASLVRATVIFRALSVTPYSDYSLTYVLSSVFILSLFHFHFIKVYATSISFSTTLVQFAFSISVLNHR